MAERKASDHGEAEVQATSNKETDQGFVGAKVDPVDNAEYTLTTGPDSPPYFDDDTTRADQHSTNPKKV